MVKTPMLSSSFDFLGWIERYGWDFGFPSLWAWICHMLGMVGIKRIGLVEMINCLNASHFIIILMKSLCCLPKCGVNPQISLQFIVYLVSRLIPWVFSYSTRNKTPEIYEENEIYSRVAWILWIYLSLELFLTINPQFI